MSTQLRRRGELKPLDPSHRELDSDESDVFDILYISPCQIKISNDPFEAFEIGDLIPCNTTEYKCFEERGVVFDTTTNSDGTSKLTVRFDYELWATKGSDVDTTVSALEGSILQHLAAVTGLEDCTSAGGATATLRSGGRNLQFTEEETNLIVGISSDPLDNLDEDFDSCIVPVQSSSVAGAECLPMNGAVTATVNADLKKEYSLEYNLQNKMLNVLRQSMLSDVYTSGPVRKVSFIGARADDETYTGEPNQSNTAKSSGDGGLTGVGIGFLCAGCVLAVSLIALFVAKKRRQRRSKNTERELDYGDANLVAAEIAPVDDDAYHKRNNPVEDQGVDGADVAGSLAAEDALALQPQMIAASTATEVLLGATSVNVDSGDDASSSEPSSPESKDSLLTESTESCDLESSPESEGSLVVASAESGDSSPETRGGSGLKPMSPEDVLEHLTDTSSLEGATEDTILHRLYNISEIDESLMGSSDEEDSVSMLKKAPGYGN